MNNINLEIIDLHTANYELYTARVISRFSYTLLHRQLEKSSITSECSKASCGTFWARLFTQPTVHQGQIYLMTTGESAKHLRTLLWNRPSSAISCHKLNFYSPLILN